MMVCGRFCKLPYVRLFIILCAVVKVGFEEKNYTLVEGENSTICLTFDKKLEKSITVYSTLMTVSGGCCFGAMMTFA